MDRLHSTGSAGEASGTLLTAPSGEPSFRRSPALWLASAAVIGLGLLLLLVVGLMASAGDALTPSVLAIVIAVGIGLVILRPSPLVQLAVVLGLQVFQLGGEAGLGVTEVVAGLALVGYLGFWYLTAILSPRPVLTSLFDVAAVTWGIGGLVIAAVLGQTFGADAYDFRADILATLPFLFYLPVKDACARSPHASPIVGATVIGFGLYATVQSGLQLRSVISGAAALYEVADARFITGETSIAAGLMFCLAGLTALDKRWHRLVLIALAGLLMGGLILTKSRGFWISTAFGLGIIGLVALPRARRTLVAYGLGGILLLVGFAMVFFGDQLALIALGALDRLLSITTAGRSVSILNRYAESLAAWEMIRVNPVLGYGWGVQVTHYSVISSVTRHWAFLHNGYLALWLKTGLWGLGLVLSVWAGGFFRAIRAARHTHLSPSVRAAGLATAGMLAAFVLISITSNPFSVLDQMLVITLMMAVAHGVGERARAVPRGS